jgi:hypothetical protein
VRDEGNCLLYALWWLGSKKKGEKVGDANIPSSAHAQ